MPRLRAAEAKQYENEGFFVREAVFDAEELERLRAAAERVVEQAECEARAVSRRPEPAPGSEYRVDGNRYVEASRSTVQFEHRADSETIRVIEPFHHLAPEFDALVEDPRLVAPLCGVLGADRIALWTDKINQRAESLEPPATRRGADLSAGGSSDVQARGHPQLLARRCGGRLPRVTGPG